MDSAGSVTCHVMCGYREVNFGLLIDRAYQELLYGSTDIFQLRAVSAQIHSDAIIGVLNLHSLRPQDASFHELIERFNNHRFRMLVTVSRQRLVTMDADRVHALMSVAPQNLREEMCTV